MSREITYEYREDKIRTGSPILQSNPDRQYRYRSLYGYGADTASTINSNGHTRDLSGCVVYSDCLIIDCDTTEEAEAVLEIIKNLDIASELWTTGNRGCHIHIPIVPMQGTDVIWSQISWLRDIGVWELVDKSIYREGGQIRVPGAEHEKTGKIKEKLLDIEGEILEIPLRKSPPKPVASTTIVEGTKEAKAEYHRNLLYQRTEGNRHLHMFILWKRGRSAGYDDDTIRDDIRWWNDNMAVPSHPWHVVEQKLRSFR